MMGTRQLRWHEGRHGWDTHDGYPRHQHSLNGVLTIRPGDTHVHFAWGPGFDPPGAEQEAYPDWVRAVADRVSSSADQALIDAMLAHGEDVSDRKLWVPRRDAMRRILALRWLPEIPSPGS